MFMLQSPEIPLRLETVFREGNFPLIDRFAQNLPETVKQREQIFSALKSNDTRTIIAFGFPQDVIPVMQLWSQEGPDILTSFSHPEEFDLDKLTALLNLRMLQERMRLEGVEFPRILINHYDTIRISNSAKKPLKFGSFGNDFDIFGVRKSETSTVDFSPSDGQRLVDNFRESADGIGGNIFEQLKPAIIEEMKSIDFTEIKGRKAEILKTIEGGIKKRVSILVSILNNVAFRHDTDTVGSLLNEFQRDLFGGIFSVDVSALPLEDSFGFESSLASKNDRYMELVRKSTKIIISTKGLDFLKTLIEPTEGLASIDEGDTRAILTKNEEDEFVLMSRFDSQALSDEEVVEMIGKAAPLSKLETLTLIAGAFTFHMGSEYGVRERVIKCLGIQGRAASFIAGLRISQDKEQGNYGIVMDGSSTFLPVPLALVLFGREGIKDIISQQIGKTNEPLRFSQQEFRFSAAKSLLNEALDPKSEISVLTSETSYYGMYS